MSMCVCACVSMQCVHVRVRVCPSTQAPRARGGAALKDRGNLPLATFWLLGRVLPPPPVAPRLWEPRAQSPRPPAPPGAWCRESTRLRSEG